MERTKQTPEDNGKQADIDSLEKQKKKMLHVLKLCSTYLSDKPNTVKVKKELLKKLIRDQINSA